MLIVEQAGIRAMLTYPIDEEAAKFYTRFGFIASPLREQQLLLLLKDLPSSRAERDCACTVGRLPRIRPAAVRLWSCAHSPPREVPDSRSLRSQAHP